MERDINGDGHLLQGTFVARDIYGEGHFLIVRSTNMREIYGEGHLG